MGCADDSSAPAATEPPPLAAELATCDGRAADAVDVDAAACLEAIRDVINEAATQVPRDLDPWGPLEDAIAEVNDTLQTVYPQTWGYSMEGTPPIDADAVAEPVTLDWQIGTQSARWWVCPVGTGVEISDTECG